MTQFLSGLFVAFGICAFMFGQYMYNQGPFSEELSKVFVEKRGDQVYMSIAAIGSERAYAHATMDKVAAMRVVNDINNALREEGAGRDASGVKTWAVPSGVTHVEITTWKGGGGDGMATDIHVGKGGGDGNQVKNSGGTGK